MRKLALAIFMLCFSIVTAFAQSSTGSLVGTVSSPDGVIAGATVVVTDNATRREQTATTNGEGFFTFPQLEFGTYTVRTTAAGFKTTTANELKIDVGREYSLNQTLEVGAVTEEVTVIAGADILNSTSAEISATVSPQQIQSLPLVTRNPLDFIQLQAGAASNAFQGTSINGLRTTFTNVTRDGINIQDAFIRTNATDFVPGRPSVDDTSEFTFVGSNGDSDQGYGGAQIRLVTPRGGSIFSGALFAYNRNSEFGANNFFNNRNGTPRPFRNRNQFGGKIGGPFPAPNFGEGGPVFVKGKTAFFFAYEQVIDPLSTLATRTVFTPGARTGAFQFNRATAGAANTVCPSGTVGSVCTVPNILTFAGLPATIDPTVQSRIISALPLGNRTDIGDGLNTTGFGVNRAINQERKTYTARIDYDINDTNTINGVYSYNNESNLRNDVDATGFSAVPTGQQTSTNKTLALAYRTSPTANFTNEVRGGLFFSTVPFFRTVPIQDFFLDVSSLISNPENNFLNQDRATRSYNIQDSADLIAGNHSFRFGGIGQFFQVNATNAVGTLPTYTLGTNANTPLFSTANFSSFGGISNAQLGTANNLLGILGGIVSSASQSFNTTSQTSGFTSAPTFQNFRNNNFSFFGQDRWRVSPQLSLTLGLRYEVFTPLRLENGLALEPIIPDGSDIRSTILNPLGQYGFIGGIAGNNQYYNSDNNNFAPNIGFAYTPQFKNKLLGGLFGESGRTVIRGGYSQVFGNDSIVTSFSNAGNSNVGLGRTGSSAQQTINGVATANINARLTSLPPINPPAFITPPRSFLQNNTAQFGNFGTVYAIEPDIQTPRVSQYSVGIQREVGFQSVIELRYVGSYSKNLLRAIDINQIDIRNNGFLTDFNRAAANLAIVDAERRRLMELNGGVLPANAPASTGLFQPAFAGLGLQPLTIFTAGGSTATPVTPGVGRLLVGGNNGLNATTFNNNLRNGTPADLATNYITNGLNGGPRLPTTANPNAAMSPQFINFLANPGTGVVDLYQNGARFNYNSLQAEFRRRFAQGLAIQANYTFSKNLTNSIGTSQALFEPFLDNANPDLDYQRADFDQTHVFNFNGIYELPFGKGKRFLSGSNGFVNKLIEGFQISSIVRYGSGVPVTFVDTRGTLNRTARSARQTVNSTLTNDEIQALVGVFRTPRGIFFINPSVLNVDPNVAGSGTGRAAEGFSANPNDNSFAGQVFFNVRPGETGNLGRSLINSPNTFNVDAALIKNFSVTERTRVQLRFEAFNALNSVNFLPSTQAANINSTTFGQLTQTTSPRVVQFAARFEF